MKRILLLICSFVLLLFFSKVIAIYVTTTIIYHLGYSDLISLGLVTFISYSSSMLLMILLTVLLKGVLKLDMSNLVPRLRNLNLPLIVMAVVIIFAIDIVIAPLLYMMPKEWMGGVEGMMRGGAWAVITAVVVAPLLEEFVFRGTIQRTLTKASSPYLGIVLSSIIFGLIHMVPQQIVNATMVGLVLGAIFYLTDSLMTVVAIHILNNGIAYLQFLYLGPDTDTIELLLGHETTYHVLYALSCLLIVAFGIVVVLRIKKKTLSLTQVKP